MRISPRSVTPRTGMWEAAANYDSPWALLKLAALRKAGGSWCTCTVLNPHTQSNSLLAACYLASPPRSFPLALPWEAVLGAAARLWKMFDEDRDISSWGSMWLWLTVSITWEYSSHGEAVGWGEKVGRRPTSPPGDGRPSSTGRTCRTATEEPLPKTCKSNSPLSSKLAGGARRMSVWPADPLLAARRAFQAASRAGGVCWWRSERVSSPPPWGTDSSFPSGHFVFSLSLLCYHRNIFFLPWLGVAFCSKLWRRRFPVEEEGEKKKKKKGSVESQAAGNGIAKRA